MSLLRSFFILVNLNYKHDAPPELPGKVRFAVPNYPFEMSKLQPRRFFNAGFGLVRPAADKLSGSAHSFLLLKISAERIFF